MAYPGKLPIFIRAANTPRWACDHRRDVLDPSTSAYRECPACANQARRNRNHWAALALVAALVLLVAWRSL